MSCRAKCASWKQQTDDTRIELREEVKRNEKLDKELRAVYKELAREEVRVDSGLVVANYGINSEGVVRRNVPRLHGDLDFKPTGRTRTPANGESSFPRAKPLPKRNVSRKTGDYSTQRALSARGEVN